MPARIGEFGFTANRVAAIGLSLFLVVNLTATAWLLAGMLARRALGGALERRQTGYLPVAGAWAGTMVFLMPALFGFS